MSRTNTTRSILSKLRLGLIVGHNETWSFIEDLYEDWQQHYQIDVFEERTTRSPFFKERLNRRLLRADLSRFMAQHDAVFFEWATDYLVIASRLPRTGRIVTRLHSYELFQFGPDVNWSNVDRVILVSQAMQKRFCSLYPEAASKTVVVYNGVDLEKFQPRAGQAERTIGMLCNLIPIKRVYEIILELYELRQTGHAFKLRVGGAPRPGPENDRYYAAMLRLIDRLGMADCVSLDGFIEEAPAFLNDVEIFISNSFWEGQQVALLEAMASGCYCLSHCWDGADEVLPPENIYVTGSDMRVKMLEYAELSAQDRFDKRLGLRIVVEEKFDNIRTKERMRNIIESVASS